MVPAPPSLATQAVRPGDEGRAGAPGSRPTPDWNGWLPQAVFTTGASRVQGGVLSPAQSGRIVCDEEPDSGSLEFTAELVCD